MPCITDPVIAMFVVIADAQLAETPSTDPYAGCCGRSGAVRLHPIPISINSLFMILIFHQELPNVFRISGISLARPPSTVTGIQPDTNSMVPAEQPELSPVVLLETEIP